LNHHLRQPLRINLLTTASNFLPLFGIKKLHSKINQTSIVNHMKKIVKCTYILLIITTKDRYTLFKNKKTPIINDAVIQKDKKTPLWQDPDGAVRQDLDGVLT
jgi:hypothetical protein